MKNKLTKNQAIFRKSPFGCKQALLMVILGAFLGLTLNVCFSLIGITESSEAFQEVRVRQFSKPLMEGLLLYGLLAPLLEEVIFRMFIYGVLRKFTGAIAATAASAVLFGLYHGNPVQGLYAFLMGLIFAVSYEKYQNLQAPILLHGGANAAVFLVAYFG